MDLSIVIRFLFVSVITLVNLFISLAVYIRNPKSLPNKIFALTGIVVNLWIVFMYLSTQPFTNNPIADFTGLFLIRVSIFFATLMSFLFFILAQILPLETLKLKKRYVIALLASTFAVMIFTISPYVFEKIQIENKFPSPIPGPAIGIFVIFVIFLNVSGGYVLLKKINKFIGIQREQLRYFTLGLLTMQGLTILTILLPTNILQNPSLVPLAPIYAFIFLFLIAYAIVRHRLLDIRLIVIRSVTYILLIFVLGGGYSGLLFIINSYLTRDRNDFVSILVSAALVPFIVFSFQPLRRFFEKITNKFLYKDKYDANTLLWDLSRIMASTLKLSDLSKQVFDKLLSSVKINYGAIVLTRNSSIIWVGGGGSTSDRPFKGKDIYELIHASNKSQSQKENILIFEELSESKIKNTMREHNITVVLPLVVRKELIGGILLGEKSSGEVYSSEDIDLLKIFAPEVAVAVKNALSYEEIRRFNITLEEEVKHATEKLRKANTKLKELDNLKDEFVSIASHELRTPMTAVKSYLWMAINQPGQTLKDQLKKYLEISYASTERLIRLVNDMLTVSRIERNKIELKLEIINVCDIVKMVHDELKISADQKHINFQLLGCETNKYNVKADKEKLREVFQNIVGNALKFTPEKGKITINLKMSGQNKVAITIADTGPGIPKEDMSKLFQKFSRIEYSYTKHSSMPGTGLGLYISKQIVGLHNGNITVESEVNVGTTFTVLLPTV